MATRPCLPTSEPRRTVCDDCSRPVIVAVVDAVVVIAEIHEWEPRAACEQCRWTRARMSRYGDLGGRRISCARCGDSGYVGESRPPGRMLGIDVAWSDEGHVRTVGPSTARKRGEALYRLHVCAPLAVAA